MARLESQGKMGYYPTPPEEIFAIKKALELEGPGLRFLDPCCGDGEALRLLTEGTEAETLGIELEKSRYEGAKEKLNRVLWADALTETKISAQIADVLFLNPPYDTSSGKRLEAVFLESYYKTLPIKGVLILIVPLNSLASARNIICSHFAEIHVYRFQDPEFDRFKQVVLIARRKRLKKEEIEANEEYFNILSRLSHKLSLYGRIDFITTEGLEKIKIPVKKRAKPNYTFTANHIDPEELQPQVRAEKEAFFKKMALPDLESMTPLMPLKQGHLAMLLAAGYINGELKQDGFDLVIKGSTVRGEETIEESDTCGHDVTIYRSRPEITITVLNMDTGEIREMR